MLPHRFIGNHLPLTVSKVVIIHGTRPPTKACSRGSGTHGCSQLCPKVINDLQKYLESLNRSAEVWPPSENAAGTTEIDWARLAFFRTVFSWPSTFSFTAFLGNPHRVFFPYNAMRMLLVASPYGAIPSPHAKWNWVESDFIPGAEVGQMSWDQVRSYLNSESCFPERHRCVPAPSDCPG